MNQTSHPTSAVPGRSVERTAVLAYGVVSYLVFVATFIYAIGFVGNVGVTKSIDGVPTMGVWPALAINLALLSLFAIQHSVMARPAFKRWWTQIIPPATERSTYVLLSSLALIVVFVGWEPLGGVVWNIDNPVARGLFYAGFAFGWGLVLTSTFVINHFDLFGLRHVWLFFRGRPYAEVAFVTPWPYRVVRHPLYLGWLFAFWSTPTMTITHLVFAAVTTAYILGAVRLEERDLRGAFDDYADYQKEVPMLVPRLRGKKGALADQSTQGAWG